MARENYKNMMKDLTQIMGNGELDSIQLTKMCKATFKKEFKSGCFITRRVNKCENTFLLLISSSYSPSSSSARIASILWENYLIKSIKQFTRSIQF